MNAEVECPLCTQIGFRSVDALRVALVSVASRNLKCPVCNESVTGLDKLTIHLFGHTIPDHELHSASQPILTNINIPHMNTSVTPCSVLEPITVISQEHKKKVEVTPESEVPLQNFQSFQNDTSSKSLATPIINQDLSNLLCWLPVTSFPEKLSNSITNNTASISSDLILSGTNVHNQQNDDKGENRHSLSSLENSILNKDASFIILSLPSLQDMKKQFDLREISNNINNNTNDLNPSDVSTLSGKLLMLDCSGNSQCTSSVSINNPSEQSSVQIAVLPEQHTQDHSLAQSMETLPINKNSCLPKRDVSTSVDMGNQKDNNVEQIKQSTEEEPAKSSNEVLKCNLCFSQFTDPNILTLHQQLVHEGSTSFQSRFAASAEEASSKQGEDPTEKEDFSLKESKEEEAFQCHMCSKTFHMQGSLMVHLRVAHTTPTMIGLASRIKESISEQSSASTGATPGVVTPKNTKDYPQPKSSDNKQWECSDCGKFFTTKYFLKKHKRLHTGEMPYSCPKCNKSFTFQQSYHKHLLYHSDEKPHTCTDCGRSFKELSTLHNHQRIHTGEKPWACETCGKCFRQRVSYLVHRRIHTGAMPYSCTVCNKSFRYKVSQRTHKCVSQPASGVTNQAGCLLERLLFEQPGESQEKPREGMQDEHKEESTATFARQAQPAEIQSASLIPQSNQQTSDRETHLVFTSFNNDKSIYHQRLETSTAAFNLHNLQLQQTLSPIQSGSGLSQKDVVVGNAPVSLKEDLKQNVLGESSCINSITSSWCPDKQSSPGQNLDSSSLLVLVNDKEIISTGLPDSTAPVSLLQVLQKDKYTHRNEFRTQTCVNTNDLQSSSPCHETVKVGNTLLSNPFVPDFLCMALSGSNATNPNPMTGCERSNVCMGSDPFQWNVPVGHDHNSITDNESATQETMDSLQSLLFGSQSTELR